MQKIYCYRVILASSSLCFLAGLANWTKISSACPTPRSPYVSNFLLTNILGFLLPFGTHLGLIVPIHVHQPNLALVSIFKN